MSGAKVWRLRTTPERYLKIAKGTAPSTLREEIVRTTWLCGLDIRVPRIVSVYNDASLTAMIMEAVPGMPADKIRWSAKRLKPSPVWALPMCRKGAACFAR